MIDATYYSTPLDEGGKPLVNPNVASRYKLADLYNTGTQVKSTQEDIAYDEVHERSTKKWFRCPTCSKWTAKLKLSNLINHWNKCVWCNSALDDRLPSSYQEYQSQRLRLTSRTHDKQLSLTEQAIVDTEDWFSTEDFEIVFSEVEGDQG